MKFNVELSMTFLEAKKLFHEDELNKALKALDELITVNSADNQSMLLRAKIYYKMQNWGKAMNDYALVLELDPDNQEAKSGLEMARNILGYFTPDMFNP